jgi:hypothetical protein
MEDRLEANDAVAGLASLDNDQDQGAVVLPAGRAGIGQASSTYLFRGTGELQSPLPMLRGEFVGEAVRAEQDSITALQTVTAELDMEARAVRAQGIPQDMGPRRVAVVGVRQPARS